ncbi:hypothetical protein [Calycomorphotria hydatis]|nr:hypothetical protein [Calycomorphotria hydatis]
MSQVDQRIEAAEALKREWTGKRVTVDDSQPSLRRFAGREGVVKTVNMNGHALIEFDGTVDISWYDVDLAHLREV